MVRWRWKHGRLSKAHWSYLFNQSDEIILRTQPHLKLIANATEEAFGIEGSDSTKLIQLRFILNSKIGKQGLKAQLKPSFMKGAPEELEKITIVIKWGGEFTHAARYQSRDIGENFAQDLKVMSKLSYSVHYYAQLARWLLCLWSYLKCGLRSISAIQDDVGWCYYLH